MAEFRMDGIDELIKQLQEAANLEEFAPEMIDAATPILEEELKKTVQQEANKGYATGSMANSIKKSKSQRNQYGYFGIVRPTGKDKNGVRNMEKLAYLHYGTTKQEAHPVVTKAVFHAEGKVIEKMQEKFNEKVGRIWT